MGMGEWVCVQVQTSGSWGGKRELSLEECGGEVPSRSADCFEFTINRLIGQLRLHKGMCESIAGGIALEVT